MTKKFFLYLSAAALCAGMFAAEPNKPEPVKPFKERKLSELEVEKFKRMALQLDALRRQYEQNAAPVATEQNELLRKVCGEANITVQECGINVDAGVVVHNTPPKPADAAPSVQPPVNAKP